LFRRLSVPAAAILLLSACGPGGPDTNEILWDTWGVPHIYGVTDQDVFRGQGWAQMESHGDLILRLYGEARGRAAEYWGEAYVDSDRFVRTMGIPTRGAEWLAGESDEMRGNLEAFAAGMNAYAAAHPDLIDDEVEVVLPVTAADILSHSNRGIHFTFITNAGVTRQANRALSSRTATGSFPIEESQQQRASRLGSNTWAVGPTRSASGNAMLLSNPHLPWEGLFTLWETHLVAPGVDVYGTTLVGVPGIVIGFNDRLGWSHTVNTYDGADLFRIELEGDGYRFGEEVRDFETREETILIKQDDGMMRVEPLTVRASLHGPLIADDGGHAIALRVAGLEKAGVVGQWWDMARAGSLEEFESILARLQIPMFNVMYADADGHTLYLFGGSVPERSMGDVATWAGVVDGGDPSTLWTTYHSYDELPRIVDPADGWMQNANDPPWTSTVPQTLSPGDFPAYLSPTGMAPRPQRSANILRADDSITFDELVEYKHNTVMENALRIVDELVDGARASGHPVAMEAADVLAAWDRTSDADSRGGLLFEAWIARWLRSGTNWSTPWSAEAPADTPDGLADPAGAVRLLVEAAADVRAERGALDTPWGDVHRARRNGHDVPVSGGPGYPHGVFRVAVFQPMEDGSRQVVHGDTYYSVAEFTPDGVNARVLLAYGNATQPHSPHNGDQLDLYSRQEMRIPWRTRAEIEANLESRTDLGG